MHIHPLEACFARILVVGTETSPVPSGAGVALRGGRVLTCAHVVNTALNLPEDSSGKPEKEISLDFPLSGSHEIVKARVGFWESVTDLAELQILGALPSEVIPTSVRMTDELWDHRVQAFGFPSKNLDGTWADCQLRGPNTRGWLEVFDPKTTGNFIKQGFSGGPVWDSNLECVIGIIVAVERNDEARVGYLIPAYKILERWQELPVSPEMTPPPQEKDIPDLIPYLVNRQKQEDDLLNFYRNNIRQNPLPLVVIVHGDDMQASDMFHLRMTNQFIPQLLKINPRQTPLVRFSLPWPTYTESLNEARAQLIKRLGWEVLGDAGARSEDIQQIFASYNSPIIIETELLTSDWVKFNGKEDDILEVLLDFWNNWPSLSSSQRLFIFIYITYKIPNVSQNKRRKYNRCKRKTLMQLEHCTFDDYRGICGTVLSELRNISEAETRQWARSVAREYFRGEITTLIAKIRKLFEDQETIAMEPLASQLKEILVSSPGV